MEPIIEVTRTELVAAFTKWTADFRDNPEQFLTLEEETPREYGESAADFLIELLTSVTP